MKRALFGMTAVEVSLEENFSNSVSRDRVPVGGLLLPDEDGNYHHRNLSAVISCDWFDTLNRQDQGKRLHCLVLHNWTGEPLPEKAFGLFPQIIWNQSGQDAWEPEQTTNANRVAKFTPDGEIECRDYTPDTAWKKFKARHVGRNANKVAQIKCSEMVQPFLAAGQSWRAASRLRRLLYGHWS